MIGWFPFPAYHLIQLIDDVTARFKDTLPFPNELYPENWFRRLEPVEVFPDRLIAPVEIDLGCGDGGFLLALADQFSERNFLGVERLLGRARKVCRNIDRRGLDKQVRVLRLETVYAVEWLLPRNFADRVHLLFPDPWPKKKHQKRRLMCQESFLRSVHSLLKPGGELLFKTDHSGYFEDAVEMLGSIDFFERIGWADDAFVYPETDFERQWIEGGREIQRMRLLRV